MFGTDIYKYIYVEHFNFISSLTWTRTLQLHSEFVLSLALVLNAIELTQESLAKLRAVIWI